MKQLSGIAPGDWITVGSRRQPTARCLVRPGGESMSYQEVGQKIDLMVLALQRLGVRHGDRIAVLAIDSPEYVIAMFASFKLGSVFVPINFRLAQPEIEYLVTTTKPAAVLISSRYASFLPMFRLAAPKVIIGLDGCDGVDFGIADLTTGNAPADALVAQTEDDDILCLIMTSGTTGRPKTARQSQRMLKANTAKGVIEQGFRPDDLVYAGPPLFHVAGMGFNLYGLSRGAASLILNQFDAAELIDCISRLGITRLLLVPSMISAILMHPDISAEPYRTVRSIAYGGSPMPPTLVSAIDQKFGCDLYNTFGAATEGGGQTVLRPEDHRRALAGETHLLQSIGRAQYGIELKLCDSAGHEVATREIGEIWTRSDTVMSGYLGDPELTERVISDGWFHGGDLAWRDEEGFLYLAGRADDMIIRGGENIYPNEIETIIRAHPAITDVAVLGVPDLHWGQRVVAVVATNDGDKLSSDEVHQLCRSRLAAYKVPDRWFRLDDLPRNSTGKTDTPMLRKLLEDDAIPPLTKRDEVSERPIESARSS